MQELISKLFGAFNTWFQNFGAGKDYDWSSLSLTELWGDLLQAISNVFAGSGK
ncbi:MAG: hypothetical protein LBJ12_05685 [Oscillospiraceae bacterium]|jgi:hypothetical protein|nr:hypothetical protein [Oscillospiraceae bacterium]